MRHSEGNNALITGDIKKKNPVTIFMKLDMKTWQAHQRLAAWL